MTLDYDNSRAKKDPRRLSAALAKDDALDNKRRIFDKKISEALQFFEHDFAGRRDHIDYWRATLEALWYDSARTILFLGALISTPANDQEEVSGLLGHLLSSIDNLLWNASEIDRPLRRMIELNIVTLQKSDLAVSREPDFLRELFELWEAQGAKLYSRLAQFAVTPKRIRGLCFTFVQVEAECLHLQHTFENLWRTRKSPSRLVYLVRLLSILGRLQPASRFASLRIHNLFR